MAIAVFTNDQGDDGTRKPTKKGFALAVDKLPELIEALQEAEQVAIGQGLLKANSPAAGASVLRDVAGNKMTILNAG